MTTDPVSVYLVPHFHMDPVWWNTQRASIDQFEESDWSGSPRMGFQRSAIDILEAHIDAAERDSRYRFCIAEVDYLEPFWLHRPHRRATLLGLIDAGQVEVVGATYNEPNSNLVSLEVVRRNLQHGLRFQRGVLGAAAEVSWQLDVFGHDPSLPSILASAGVRSVVFARGPFRPWGPFLEGGFDTPKPTDRSLIPSEFEWLSPDGQSVFGVYLAGHYSSGYQIDRCDDLDDAQQFISGMVAAIGPMAATKNVIIPVGTDIGPPARWVTDLTAGGPVGEATVATPSVAIDVIRAELDSASGPSPQSRDMNPVYTGKDVSYIDTKQANRAAEHLLYEAELWATMAVLTVGFEYPAAELDDAWRLLVYGSHHDAITGTESDQVYLDLLAGWRRAHALALRARTSAVAAVARQTNTTRRAGSPTANPPTPDPEPHVAVIVHNSTPGRRRDIVSVRVAAEIIEPLGWRGLRAVDERGGAVPLVVDSCQRSESGALKEATVSLSVEVEGIGRRTFHLLEGDHLPVWQAEPAVDQGVVTIADGARRLSVDAVAGGCVTEWTDGEGLSLITPGRLGNELAIYPEYSTHPANGEGPWHLSPCGPATQSSSKPANVVRLTSPLGERLIIDGCTALPASSNAASEGAEVRHQSTLTLWHGVDRLDGRVVMDGLDGADHLVRLRWPVAVAGSRPTFEAGETVIGRGYGLIDVDAAAYPWTLDTPANNWFGNSTCARLVIGEAAGATELAFGVAEVVVSSAEQHPTARTLIVALGASGVTATCTLADRDRYGSLDVDSNAPDVRFIAGVAGSDLVERVIGRMEPVDAQQLRESIERDGSARALWCGPESPEAQWMPGLDVTGETDLPVVLIVGLDDDAVAAEVAALANDLNENIVSLPSATLPSWVTDTPIESRTVAIVNRGTPGGAVTSDGTLHLSLSRACTAWPSAQWIDPPRRTMPDGSSFQLQHWTHEFDYSLVARSGDWRTAGVVRSAREVQSPLFAVVELPHDGLVAPAEVFFAPDDPTVEVRAVLCVADPGQAKVIARLGETAGTSAVVSIESALPIAPHRAVDLRGEPVTGVVEGSVLLDPYQCATIEFSAVSVPDTPAHENGVTTSTRFPSFSRWWVQSSGPRPTACGPASVTLNRNSDIVAGDRWSVTLAHAPVHISPLSDGGPQRVTLAVEAPEGWLNGPAVSEHVVEPGSFEVFPLDLAVPPEIDPGHYVVRVVADSRSEHGERSSTYDEIVVSVGVSGRYVGFAEPPRAIELTAGRTTTVAWSLRNETDASLLADVELLSPWGTWDWFEHRQTVELAPRAVTAVEFEITPSPSTQVGSWWCLARAAIGPSVLYSASSSLSVTS